MRGACTPSSVVGSDPPDAHPLFITRRCFSASDLDIVPPESCFIIPPGAFGAAAAVRCTRHLVGKVVCTDAAGRSFPFTTCGHLSAWNRKNLPLASSVSTARDAYAPADGVRGACTLSSVAYSDTPDAHLVFTDDVRGACTQFRSDRLRRPCGTLTQPLLECVVRVLPAAIVVFTDPVGHSLSLGSL